MYFCEGNVLLMFNIPVNEEAFRLIIHSCQTMAIPTFKPVILYQQIRRDGSCNVKMRITHKRKTKYIATTVTAFKGDYDKEYKLKNSVLLRLSDLMKDIAAVIATKNTFDWDALDVEQACMYIAEKLRPQEEFRLDFFQWAETVLATKSESSASNYRCSLNAFERFLETREIDISKITSSLMRRFEAYLVDKHGKDARAVSMYTSCIATIHSEARKTYNDNELGEIKIRNPFEFYTPPKQRPALKRTIEFDTIQRLIDIREHLGEYHKLAVDIYLLSFCLMGSNVPDMYEAERVEDVIYYNRKKTRTRRFDKAEMRVRLEPVCGSVISGLLDPDNKRAFRFHINYKTYQAVADKANDRLKEVAKVLEVEPFTIYSARHTWASIAYSIGIPKSLINDCLCHVDPDMAVTDIYIKKDWSVLWEANRKVLEQFEWE